MNRIFILAVFLLVFVFIGCYTPCEYIPPENHSVDNKIEINKSYNDVWISIIDIFVNENLTITEMDKSTGFILIKDVLFSESYADCGRMECNSGFYKLGIKVFGDINIFINEIENNKAIVHISVGYKGISEKGTKFCYSYGDYEEWFLHKLKEKTD